MPQANSYKFIDMHCHILPGIDDGSKNPEMSLAMAKIAADNNIGTIIVTPHYNAGRRCASPDGIRRRAEEMQKLCESEGLDLTFFPGNELYYDSELPGRLTRGEVLTLADSKYCLIEFNPSDDYRYIQSGLKAVLYEGFHPILAHCERYLCLVKKPELAAELSAQGVLLQVNASSVETRFLQPIPKFVNGLLKQKLIRFVATDAHRSEGERTPALAGPAAWLANKYDGSYVRQILQGNAQQLIDGETI